uniref:SHSP domain-containing protein n=1 Tax=Cucumis sativus TaxID=3659 RepID=A0A0A0L1N9_CUCSA
MASSNKHHRTYEDFEPPVEQSEEDGCTILALYIPGFNKEQIKVQVSSKRKLRISGERALKNNNKHIMQRFNKEFEIPSNCNTTNITAKYKSGILHVRQPLQQDQSDSKQQPHHNPILEDQKVKQTNLASNHNEPHSDTPKDDRKFTTSTGQRLKETIPCVFLKLVLPILLPSAFLLLWYARRLSPIMPDEVEQPSH